MASNTIIIIEMLLTLGLCLGFGFYQLWSLKRAKAERLAREARTAEAARDAGNEAA